jgi:nitronate monooxygenase
MIRTRLTARFGLTHPILSAPMAFAAGGRLAAAVTTGGGLGLIGGGYADAEWVENAFAAAADTRVGCGFITWRLGQFPRALDVALAHKPAVIMLSFGDPAPYASRLAEAGVDLICQIQTLRDAVHAAEIGAAAIVAQGAEAGGHGEGRATLTLVPEVADWLTRHSPDTLLLAAGGIADGRGLAAALMLGADGVLVGSRLWASEEADVSEAMHRAATEATGDDTIRTSVMDVARRLDWPERYSCRVLRNAFTDRWHGDPETLRAEADILGADWQAAFRSGDPEGSNTFVGEAVGLIRSIRSAGEIMAAMVADAEALLDGGWRKKA